MRFKGGRGEEVREVIGDNNNNSIRLIKQINAEPINKTDGVNMLYLAKLSFIKRKPIDKLTGKEKDIARQAYLSLLNRGETENSINSDKLEEEMRKISEPEIPVNQRGMMLQNMRAPRLVRQQEIGRLLDLPVEERIRLDQMRNQPGLAGGVLKKRKNVRRGKTRKQSMKKRKQSMKKRKQSMKKRKQ